MTTDEKITTVSQLEDARERREAIRDETAVWIRQNSMFTSVDIANSLKQRGVWIRNRDVAGYLRDNAYNISLHEGNPYTMSVINVTLPNGSNTEASLYHPQGTNPNIYDKTDQRALTPDEAQNDSPFDGDEPELDGPGCRDDKFLKYVASSLPISRLRAAEPRPSQVINIDYVETLVINIGTDFEMDVDDDD